MLPSIFGENLFDEFFSDPFAMVVPQGHNPLYGKHGKDIMKTDVRETENSYELDVDLPAGTYECTAYFHNLDPDSGAIIGTAGAIITITVKN